MAKTWATKCCSGTYKNNYQLCCGIKVYKPAVLLRVKLFFVTKPVAMPISVCGFAQQTEQSLNLYIKKLR